VNTSKPRRKNYQQHYANQRERILEAAEKLFIQKGINNVSMVSIAKAARMAPITLYEYFPNKEAVAWAIFQKLIEGSKAPLMEPLPAEATGYQRLEFLTMQMVNQFETHPESARFLVEFNMLYARESSLLHLLKTYQQGRLGAGNPFTDAIRQGIADGSIQPDVDPDLLTSALMNFLNAVNSRFALLGDLIGEEYGQPTRTIYQEICRTFLRGIQSHPLS